MASSPPKFGARRLALDALVALQRQGRTLDEALDAAFARADLASRDRGFMRALVTVATRRRGQVAAVLARFVTKALPRSAGPAAEILALLATEILFLDVPPHAAVSEAVDLASADRDARAFRGLINAVGRRLVAEGKAVVDAQDAARLNTPDDLWRIWVAAYGQATAHAIATAHLSEAPLDLSLKGAVGDWPAQLDALVLPNGTLRRYTGGRVEDLAGFNEGAWWVQDAAAALPPRFLKAKPGQRVLDLCAAPGGKTLALAAAGALVTALDRSAPRLNRLRSNLARTQLKADVVEADGLTYRAPTPFPLILLDAPCSATGTIRRHPDVAWTRADGDLTALMRLQDGLIDSAHSNLAPGGTLVFATCSLDPREGEARIDAALMRHKDLRLDPITPDEVAGAAELLRDGRLRALPCHWAPQGGLDGFFAARLIRRA